MSYTITIISPIFNVAKYIVRCMESLSMQTLAHIEVIFVDDHSTDNSIQLIQEYITMHALNEDWHILQTPTNQGPAAARNIGIDAAKGEYIAFVDADDWIEGNMMQILYNLAQEHNADISSSAAILDFPNHSHKVMLNPRVGCGTLTKCQRRFLLQHFVSNFTTMLFNRGWLNQYNLRFPDAKSSEDSSFIGQCYLVARNIAQIDTPLYHYIIHPDSISHRKRIFRGKEKHKAFVALFQFAKDNHIFKQYRLTLYWIYIKKVIFSSVIDYIKHF